MAWLLARPTPKPTPALGFQALCPACFGNPALRTPMRGAGQSCQGDGEALAKCLAELREYSSWPSFSPTSHGACKAFFTWLAQGRDLLPTKPSTGVFCTQPPQGGWGLTCTCCGLRCACEHAVCSARRAYQIQRFLWNC